MRYSKFADEVKELVYFYKIHGAVDPNLAIDISWYNTGEAESCQISTGSSTVEFVNYYPAHKWRPPESVLTFGGNTGASAAYWSVVLHKATEYACTATCASKLVKALRWSQTPILGQFVMRETKGKNRKLTLHAIARWRTAPPMSVCAIPESVIHLPATAMINQSDEDCRDTHWVHTRAKNFAHLLGKSSVFAIAAYAAYAHRYRQFATTDLECKDGLD